MYHSNINVSFKHDKRHTEFTLSLEYHKDDGIELINYLYKNSTIYLNRKYLLYEFFKNGSRSIQEWIELQASKVGESSEMNNTEVIN